MGGWRVLPSRKSADTHTRRRPFHLHLAREALTSPAHPEMSCHGPKPRWCVHGCLAASNLGTAEHWGRAPSHSFSHAQVPTTPAMAGGLLGPEPTPTLWEQAPGLAPEPLKLNQLRVVSWSQGAQVTEASGPRRAYPRSHREAETEQSPAGRGAHINSASTVPRLRTHVREPGKATLWGSLAYVGLGMEWRC